MRLTDPDRALLDHVARSAPDLVRRAFEWCAINSGSRNLDGLSRMAEVLEPVLQGLPGDVERLPLEPTAEIGTDGASRRTEHGQALRLTVRPEAPVQVVLTGHYDTVFPAGSAFQEVRTRDDGALHGPGVADMKGGLSVMLGALAVFERHPEAGRVGYRVLISPDEEIGSIGSGPLLAEIARTGHVGLTYEPAMGEGALASSRKASGNFSVLVRGRAAHAGRDFALGRNAITAASRIAVALDALNGRREGVTVNVARVDGGGPSNQVPDVAVVRFNIRAPDAPASAWAEAGVREAVQAGGEGEGLTVALDGGFTRPAKPINAAQERLFAAVRDTGALIGLDVAWKPSGGVCEGNNLFAAGLPNLDTLGVRGGDIHTEHEFAWPESFGERAALSALVLAKLASGEIDAPAIKAAMAANAEP